MFYIEYKSRKIVENNWTHFPHIINTVIETKKNVCFIYISRHIYHVISQNIDSLLWYYWVSLDPTGIGIRRNDIFMKKVNTSENENDKSFSQQPSVFCVTC